MTYLTKLNHNISNLEFKLYNFNVFVRLNLTRIQLILLMNLYMLGKKSMLKRFNRNDNVLKKNLNSYSFDRASKYG